MRRRLLFLAAIVLSMVAAARAQTVLRHISTTEGLPNSFINQVCQDERGFMWVSSIYGLYRYDGYEFKPFKNSSHQPFFLPSNTVVSLAADMHGHLWIGTQDGVSRMTLVGGDIRRYSLPDASHQRVNRFCITRGGTIYVGTMRGLFRYDAQKDTLLAVSAIGTVNVQCVIEDEHGDLLVGTWSDGLMRYHPKSGSVKKYDSLTDAHCVYAICRRKDGSVLLGTHAGLLEATFAPDGSLLSSSAIDRSHPVYALAAVAASPLKGRKENRNAIGSNEERVYVGRRNGLHTLTPARTLQPTKITGMARYIYADHHGMLWISTQGDGLYTCSNVRNEFFMTSFSRFIKSVAATRHGSLLTVFDEGADLSGALLLPKDRIMSVTARRDTSMYFLSVWDDGLWTATENGGLQTHYTKENCGFIEGNSLHKTLEDSNGNWWTVGYNGLGVRYADGREVSFANEESVPDLLKGELTDIVEDRDGSLWVMTANCGLVHLSGSLLNPRYIKYREYNAQNGLLPVNTPLCLLLDSSGVLWVGTNGAGLCSLDRREDRFVTLQNDYHLPGDMVCSMEEDAYSHLWIGTNRGLARLTIKGAQRGRLRIFTMRDGLPDNFFEPRASFHLDGTFYFGTGRGLVTFRPQVGQSSLSPHSVAITGVVIDDNDEVEVDDTMLTIPPMAKAFTLKFASLTYENQHQCTYTYRLVGYDEEWQTTAADHRLATYAELSPGRYTFELRATDGDGNWSKVLSLPVIVEPPFWRTWMAYIIYAAVAVLLLYIIGREVSKRMMTRNRLQLYVEDNGETQVAVRHENENVDRQHLFTFVIHDLNFSKADEEFLQQAVGCVMSHLSDFDLDAQQMTELMGTSHAMLTKKLKAMTGMNANALISDIRLKTARRMMDEHSADRAMRISDLAHSVGFSDPMFFAVSFRKKFGLSATEYLERRGKVFA